MPDLKQSTATTITLGPFVDATDAVTPETGLDLSTVDAARLTKSDGTEVDLTTGYTLTHDQNGVYDLAVTATDTDTVGWLRVDIQDADVCLPFWCYFSVIHAAEWGRKYEGEWSDSFVAPYSTELNSPNEIECHVTIQQHSSGPNLTWTPTDSDGNSYDFSTATELRLQVYTDDLTIYQTFDDATEGSLSTTSGGKTIVLDFDATDTASAGTWTYTLWALGLGGEDLAVAKGAWVVEQTVKDSS